MEHALHVVHVFFGWYCTCKYNHLCCIL